MEDWRQIGSVQELCVGRLGTQLGVSIPDSEVLAGIFVSHSSQTPPVQTAVVYIPVPCMYIGHKQYRVQFSILTHSTTAQTLSLLKGGPHPSAISSSYSLSEMHHPLAVFLRYALTGDFVFGVVIDDS